MSAGSAEVQSDECRIVQFGVFELDLQTGQLRKSGIRIRLQAKSFEILRALLEQPGQIVSRDELRHRLWKEGTFGDFGTGLNTAINRLRFALGDSAEKPLYIETVARTGYRFVAPVQNRFPQSAVISIPLAAPAAAKKRWLIGDRVLGLLAILGVGAGLSVMAWFRTEPSLVTFRQVTFQRGNVWGARFTPDGQNVLYSASWEGRPRTLFLTHPASPESRALGFTGMSLSSVSSRGELAVLAAGETMNITGGTLFRVPMNGGAPLEIGRNVMSAEWSPDGNALAVVHAVRGENLLEFPIGKELYRTSGWLNSMRFSPDGRNIAFSEHPVRHDDAGAVMLIDLRGRILAASRDWDSVSGLAWHPRAHEIWFTATRRGSLRSVWAWHPPRGQVRPVAQAPGILTLRDIAPDGRVLVSRDTRRLEMAGRVGSSAEERTLTWLDWSRIQDISPDGGLILFDEDGEGAGSESVVYVYRANDANALRLGLGRAMSLAPDLRHVLTLDTHDRTHFRLMTIDSSEVVDLPKTGLEYQWGRFFPDGKRLLALASAQRKGLRLYVQSVVGQPSAAPIPITPAMAVRNVAISPVGDEVAVLTAKGELAIYPTAPGQPRILAQDEPLAPLHWSRDRYHLFVERLGNTGLPARVDRIDVRSGRIEPWREIAPPDRTGVSSVTGVAISADEQSYAYSYRRLLSELFVVDGWR
jgi:DNA-binding winged helix-turn-helix (wHTH) protein/Tol biopolymer transport system component